MARKIKHTKNELKTQRDALKRFRRYLPTLQLKKQQLQLEIRQLDARMQAKEEEMTQLQKDVDGWVRLFGEEMDFDAYIRLDSVREQVGNIAGVAIPVLEDVSFLRTSPDLFATPAWLDSGVEAVEQMIRLGVELHVLREQQKRLQEELRVTTQRVNLFEKVKIPESRENIRVIGIFLGDQQTAEVARAKIAKGKTSAREQAS